MANMELSSELKTFLVAMSPLVELRGAIPLAIEVYKLNPAAAYFFSLFGNLVPLLLIVLLGRPIADFLSQKSVFLKKIIDLIFNSVKKKTEKLGRVGESAVVVILTAIPIPFIGGWTGAISAVLLNLPAKRSSFLVFLGAAISGLIVVFLTLAVKKSLIG